jgi:integrase/recombinase XerD
MKQAKVLSAQELKRLLAVVAAGRHAARNRVAIILSHYAGLRVGEISSLVISNVLQQDGAVRTELHLNPSQAKGGR